MSSDYAIKNTEKTQKLHDKKFACVSQYETSYQNLKNSAENSTFTVYNFVRECYNEGAGKA